MATRRPTGAPSPSYGCQTSKDVVHLHEDQLENAISIRNAASVESGLLHQAQTIHRPFAPSLTFARMNSRDSRPPARRFV